MPRSLPTLTRLPLQRRRDPFDHRDWLFELKLDGFRALAYVEVGQGRLVSRNGNTFKRFAPLAAPLLPLRVRRESPPQGQSPLHPKREPGKGCRSPRSDSARG